SAKETHMAVKLQYKPGDTSLSGSVIDHIFGHSPDVIVYRDSNGRVQWEIGSDNLEVAGLLSHQRYERLRSRVTAALPGKRHRLHEDALARALFLALSEKDSVASLAHFDHVDGEIRQEALDQGRVNYVFYSSVVAVFVLAISFLSLILTDSPKYGLFFIAGMAGA